MTSTPSHGRGTAAEQGARIRAQLEEKRKGAGTPTSQDTKEHHHHHRHHHDTNGHDHHQETSTQKEDDLSAVDAEKQANAKEEKRTKKKDEKRNLAMTEKEQENITAGNHSEKESHKATTKSKSHDSEKTAATAAIATTPSAKKSPEPKLEKRGRCFPVSGIDNLALLMEGDSYQTTCFSVYMFRSELDSRTLHEFFDKLTTSYPKYRYVVELSPSEGNKKENARKEAVKKGMSPPIHEATAEEKRGRRTKYSKTLKAGGFYRPSKWRFDDNFHFQDNIIEYDQCPNGGKDDKALFDLAGDFLGEHFDYSKPLWKALCVRGLETSEGAKSALMIKVHHALSDGQGMIMSYHTALSALEHNAKIEDVQAQVDSRTKSGEQKKPGQRNIHPTLWGTTKHGFHTARGLYFGSRQAFEYSASKRESNRFYCHSDGIPMADIKLVRNVYSDAGLDLTLNDVACAVLARALRMAAERTAKGKKVKDKRVAIFVPISLRPPNNWELANFTTGGIAWFRFHDPKTTPFKEQLAQVHREMNRIKRSSWPRIWFNMFGGFGKNRAVFMPNYPLGKQFFERTYREYHVATNLPGPPKPVKFGDHEAYSYHVLPPSSPGKSSLSIGMISYADDFSLAVSCDGVQEFKQNQLAKVICQSFQDAAIELVQAAKEEYKKNHEGKEPSEQQK